MANVNNPSVCRNGSQLPLHRGALNAEELAAAVCDYCCRFPREASRQEDLEYVCQECPMVRLVALAE